jgi:hypothetical protein
MRLLRTKVWSWVDIWALKWCALLFGMIAGAYLSDIVKQYVWIFLLVAVVLSIRSSIKYFGGKD